MAKTDLADVANQIQKFWSPLFMDELRLSLPMVNLLDKKYDGQINNLGDTVYISQINAPNGQLKTAGTDADTFETEKLTTSRVAIQANKRAVASVEVEDLVQLQSQLGDPAATASIRASLMYAVAKQINTYLYSLVSPSTSSPDHLINSVTDFNATQVAGVRLLASQAKWMKDGRWYIAADPSYYNDVLSATTMTSGDYVDDKAIIEGQVATKRFGFTIVEDNSLAVDQAVAFHPDFLHFVKQTEVNFKLSDLHPVGKFGYVLSADLMFGAGLGISGSKKHILVNASASASSVVMA